MADGLRANLDPAAKTSGEETARRIRARIDEIYARESLPGDDGQSCDIGVVSVNRRRGRFISDVVHSERPHATLEIGMAWGLSTLFILQALLENGDDFRPHVVMDPCQSSEYHNAARRTLNELGIAELVEFHEDNSQLALPQLVREKRQFDLAFIDGSHQFDNVFTDLRFVHMLLKPGGVVMFDDANWDAVYLACRFAETNYGYSVAGECAPSATGSRRWFRAARRSPLRAFRKPMREVELEQGCVAPFFYGFRPRTRPHCGDIRRKGLMALAAGDRVLARHHFMLALRKDPRHFKTYLRLLRTYLPANLERMLSAKTRRNPPNQAVTG